MMALSALIRARPWQRLQRESDGVTLVEFGLISPVLFLLITGIFDMAHGMYTTSLVNGAMQAAARDLTIQGAGLRESQIDQRVIDQVRNVVPNTATIQLEKLSYDDFDDVGRPENFTDTDGDGICNNGEAFEDSNGNGQWDPNRGSSGIGGARDVVLYTVRVRYPRIFPIYRFIGIDQNAQVQGSTVLRNQPFDEQNRNVTTGNCT